MLRVSKVRSDVATSSLQRSPERSLLTAELSRAARALLGWTQQRASNEMGIAITTLAEFEGNETVTRSTTRCMIESAYNRAGASFVNNAVRVGVLLDRDRIVTQKST